MNIESLDEDCFKAILAQLPFEDFVRRARLVSTRFHQGTELALGKLVELKPLCLEVYGNCKHMRALAGHGYDDASHNYSEPATPQITLGGINVPPSKFSTLPNECKFLANVSKVHLHAAACENLPLEFRTQLCDILRSLPPSAASLKYSPNSLGCYDYGYFSDERHLTFFELTQHCTGWLSTLETIEVPEAVPYTPKNKSDFYRLLTLTERLRSLTAEVSLLFDVAGRFPATPLAGLEKLVLETRANQGRRLSKSVESCQSILETVCEHCPNLLDFSFTCAEPEDHTCISNFSVLQNLCKLRNFYVSLRHEKAYPLKVDTLPSVESMTLYIPFRWPSHVLISLVRMAPNLKSLRTSFLKQSELLIDDVITLLTRQQNPSQLKFLSIFYRSVPSHIYPDFEKLFTLQTPIALRRVEWRNLPDYNSEHFNLVLSIISRCENITQLELCVKWHEEEGRAQLRPLLLAMQRGSIRQLVLHNFYDPTTAVDKEIISQLLPTGCEIREWNIVAGKCRPESVLISGNKLSDWVDENGYAVPLEMFWVRLMN